MVSNEKNTEFLTPDSLWEAFDINSSEDFIKRFVTRGKFHKNVPEAVQSDYKLVEQLQYYSYFNYPLIDEAFGKATRIFEASIDLKIAELGIEKKGFESLNSKIKRLDKVSSFELQNQWLHSKELRNLFAHHKAGRVMGITLYQAFKHNINMINSVFLSQDEITEKENSLKVLINKCEHLKKGLFTLEFKGKRFLIWSGIPYSTSNNGIEKSFWVFHPVYAEKLIQEVEDFPKPFMLNLKELRITEDGLIAKVLETNETVIIRSTIDPLNIQKYNQHTVQMLNVNLDLKQLYWTVLKSDLHKGVTEFIYNHFWK